MDKNDLPQNSNTGAGGAIYVYYGNVNMFNGTLTSNRSDNGSAISVGYGRYNMNAQ